MSYETGTATDVSDLLTKLSTFLAAQGWTINKDAVQGSGRWLSVQKGSNLFVNYVSDPAAGVSTNPGPYIYMYGATGYNGASAYTAQPGTSGQVVTNKMTGPFTAYHFFEEDDYIHIVLEVSAGIFRHMQAGTIEKSCTFTGGNYVMGTNLYVSGNNISNPGGGGSMYPWDFVSNGAAKESYFYGDSGDGAKWFTTRNSATTGTRMDAGVGASSGSVLNNRGLGAELFRRTPSDANGITPFLPINVICEKASGLWAILGQPKDVRRVSLRNYQPNDEQTLGSDDWLIFPWTARSTTINDSTSVEKSGYFGFAYRKVP